MYLSVGLINVTYLSEMPVLQGFGCYCSQVIFGLIQMPVEDKFCLTFKKRGNIITVNE